MKRFFGMSGVVLVALVSVPAVVSPQVVAKQTDPRSDTPALDRTVTPSPTNPMGVKGVGETGTIASTPAVVNAVIDALGPLGVTHIDMPLTPERVWRAIQDAKGKAA